MQKPINDTEKPISSRKDGLMDTITKPMAKLSWKTLPTKILSEKQGHSNSMYSYNSELPCEKTDLGIGINDSIVGELKRNTQKSPVLPSQ